MLLQIKVEEAKVRGCILDQHQRLVENKGTDADANVAYKVIFNVMHGEIKEYADSMFQSFSKLKYIYDCLERVASVSKTGVEYFESKFNAEYSENTKMWNNVQELCSQIKCLDKEVNGQQSEKETGVYEYDDYEDYDFIANP